MTRRSVLKGKPRAKSEAIQETGDKGNMTRQAFRAAPAHCPCKFRPGFPAGLLATGSWLFPSFQSSTWQPQRFSCNTNLSISLSCLKALPNKLTSAYIFGHIPTKKVLPQTDLLQFLRHTMILHVSVPWTCCSLWLECPSVASLQLCVMFWRSSWTSPGLSFHYTFILVTGS